MEGLHILKKPRLKSPYMICAWPGMGEVAFKAATHLVEKLAAEKFASIDAATFFYQTGSVIQDGVLAVPELPSNNFYFWKNKAGAHDLIIFIGSAQPDLIRAEEYCQRILEIAVSSKVSRMISFAAMPQPIDHTQPPEVWFTATSKVLNDELKKLGLTVMVDGQVSGMNGLCLGMAKKVGIDGFCLLGEIPLYTIQIENPKASAAVLEAFLKIVPLPIDLAPLADQSQVMEMEINKLLDYLKLGSSNAGPIGEDEIEKIKKSLGQLTKLPASVKEKIDRLFALAKDDLSKANELKHELDKWNVYKDYEDQFLDLFKKNKDTNN